MKSSDCLKSWSLSSGSCLTALSAIFAISFMSVTASSACICARRSCSLAGSSFSLVQNDLRLFSWWFSS